MLPKTELIGVYKFDKYGILIKLSSYEIFLDNEKTKRIFYILDYKRKIEKLKEDKKWN